MRGDERTQSRPIESRILGGQCVERVGLREQPLAPTLERVLAGGVDVVALCPPVEPRPDRRRVLVAHQLANVLQLPLAGAPCGHAARGDDGVDEPLREPDLGGELGEPFRIEPDQCFAEVLQRMHVALLLGLGRRAVIRRSVGRARRIRGGAAVLQFVGPGHRSGGNPVGMGVRAPRRVGRFAMIADALPTARRVAGGRGPAGAEPDFPACRVPIRR